MFRCTFVVPVTKLSSALSLEDTAASTSESIMNFTVDSEHLTSVEYSTGEFDDGGMLIEFDCTKSGFVLGKTPLTEGRYTWKVCSCTCIHSWDCCSITVCMLILN